MKKCEEHRTNTYEQLVQHSRIYEELVDAFDEISSISVNKGKDEKDAHCTPPSKKVSNKYESKKQSL